MAQESDFRIRGIEETIRDTQRDSKDLSEREQQELITRAIEGRNRNRQIQKIISQKRFKKIRDKSSVRLGSNLPFTLPFTDMPDNKKKKLTHLLFNQFYLCRKQKKHKKPAIRQKIKEHLNYFISKNQQNLQ
jgi:hypothetical protein